MAHIKLRFVDETDLKKASPTKEPEADLGNVSSASSDYDGSDLDSDSKKEPEFYEETFEVEKNLYKNPTLLEGEEIYFEVTYDAIDEKIKSNLNIPEDNQYKIQYKCGDCTKLFESEAFLVRHKKMRTECFPANPTPVYEDDEDINRVEDKGTKTVRDKPRQIVVRCVKIPEKGEQRGLLLDTSATNFIKYDKNTSKLEKINMPVPKNGPKFMKYVRLPNVPEPVKVPFQQFAPKKGKFKCQMCGRGFGSPANLMRHEKIHSNDRAFKCEFCGKGFIQASQLIIHRRHHTGERPYACEQCNKSFINPANLRAHERLHTKERPYECNICYTGFVQSSALKKHMLKYHNDKTVLCHPTTQTLKKKYTCYVCDKSFRSRDLFNVHCQSHKDVFYKCSMCIQGFARPEQLKRHLNQHIRNGECDDDLLALLSQFRKVNGQSAIMRETFPCEICANVFLTEKQLDDHVNLSHMRTRTHQCPQCSEAFFTLARLKAHLMHHSAGQSYKCNHCKKAFRLEWHLKLHMQQHDHILKYVCKKCKEKFAFEDELQLHAQKHLSSEPLILYLNE